MLSFELSAIDLILVIAVVVLLLLHLTKFSSKHFEEKPFTPPVPKHVHPKKVALIPKSEYTKCPRGFGNIKKLSSDNSIPDRCLGCYKIMDCYQENA